MKYVGAQPIDRASAQEAFLSGDRSKICHALVGVAFFDSDWRWVQGQCIHFLNSPDLDVRRLAVVCFGHLARIHGTLDTETVLPLLKNLTSDADIGAYAEDVLDEIAWWLAQ